MGTFVKLNLLFWPVVIISLITLSLFLLGPPSGAFRETGDAELRMAYLIVFGAGIIIASAGRLLVRGGLQAARHSILWLGVFSGVFVAYAYRAELSQHYERLRGNIVPSVALSTAAGEAELRRAWDGHYRAEAEINGSRIEMMVDTGASMVLLPYESMIKIGVDPDTLDFSLPVTTANGQSTVAPLTLSEIRIGPIIARDVKAAVAHEGRLRVGLLGMSFLDKLRETTFRGDKLILRQ